MLLMLSLSEIMNSIGSVRGKLNTLLAESKTANKSKIQELKDELSSST